MKSLSDWLAFLEGMHPKGQGGIELGLERVGRVKNELQQRWFCPVIVVGGTNGKGSVCATLEAIYRAAGFRVGCYTSPHLLEYNERVRVDGLPIDDAALCNAFSKVEAARQSAGPVHLTYFEFGTLAAWEVFSSCQVHVIILEVGLGGRLDAVNIYDSDVAVITGIALDHTDWLGPTRESIGFEKAGIFRPGKPAICADRNPPQSLLAHATTADSSLRLIGRDFEYVDRGVSWSFWNHELPALDGLPQPVLKGTHQRGNAAAAVEAVRVLQALLPVDEAQIAAGLRDVRLVGRFQTLSDRPSVIVDVAHNPQAVAALVDNLDSSPCAGKTLAVVGMLADKDIAGALSVLSGKIDAWLLTDLNVPRGGQATALASIVAGKTRDAGLGGAVECFGSPEEAFRHAVGLASENDRIIAFGSFYTVAAILRSVKKTR